jgi:hypothetical protein
MKEVQDADAASAAAKKNYEKNDDAAKKNDDVAVVVRQSWDTLIQVLDHLASSSTSEQNNNSTIIETIHHHHLTQNEARQRALYWLSHQDTYDQKEVGIGFLHRYALAVIYFSLEGDSWNRCSSSSHSGTGSITASSPCPSDNERYLSSTSHRMWDGINGNRDDTITWLDLSNRNVYSDHFLPLEFTLLSPTLELVWISENPDLRGTIPEYIGEFTNLESLNVHKTNVGGVLPNSLYTLPKLSSLRLYRANFTGSISSNIGNMRRLKWLWIHENGFTGVVPEEMGTLKKLEGVTLHGNQFVPISIGDKMLVEKVQEKEVEEEVVEEVEEEETSKENRNLRRKLDDDVVDIKENEYDTNEDATVTDSQPQTDEKNDADVTLESEEKQEVESTTEIEDWTYTLKGNIIPESLCLLMKKKKLQHLWTDCEEDAFEQDVQDGRTDMVIKEGVHACSCCTRCFPKKDRKADNTAVE